MSDRVAPEKRFLAAFRHFNEGQFEEAEMKICSICKESKENLAFNKNKRNFDGLERKCKECRRLYYRSNSDQIKSRVKAHYYQNKEKIKEKRKPYLDAYRNVNKDLCYARSKAWVQRNRLRDNVKTRNYRARKRMAEGTHTSADIQKLLIEQEGRCKVCYVDVAKGYHVDHIIALVNGGSNWPSNLQILCPTCNTSKGAKDFEEWLNSQEELN